SQLSTFFVASLCQACHRAPLRRCSHFSQCLGVIPQHHTHHSSVVKEQKRRWSSVESAGDDSGAFHPAPYGAGYSALQKGGDPAAGSPTATLLRLRPSH